MDTKPQSFLEYIGTNKKIIFWSAFGIFFVYLLYAIKEVTTLLLLSYAIAVLIEPIISRLEGRGFSRATAIFFFGLLGTILIVLFLWFFVPLLFHQFRELLDNLPAHITSFGEKLNELSARWLGEERKIDFSEMTEEVKAIVSGVGTEQIRSLLSAVGGTLLKGYSFALTVFNIFLLPLFVYYIAKDFKKLNAIAFGLLPVTLQQKILPTIKEILNSIYAFVRGQLLVSSILAVLYMLGLSIAGLPFGIVVGFLAGFLNIVPYLGFAIGVVLALFICVMSGFTMLAMLKVGAVFLVVQALEGTLITPKVVGESMGLHPLAVMLALIIGGQLFGLLGVIIAIPAAAVVRVLFVNLRAAVEEKEAIELLDENVA